MAFRTNPNLPVDPKLFFIDEAYNRLKEMAQTHNWALKNGQLAKPNLQFYIREGLTIAFKEVELEIDVDFPKEAQGLKTTPEFLKIMEGYAPGFTRKHDLAMKTDDFRPMLDFLYPLSTMHQDNLKASQKQQQESKGIFARIFS
jgi:hypothetical protein